MHIRLLLIEFPQMLFEHINHVDVFEFFDSARKYIKNRWYHAQAIEVELEFLVYEGSLQDLSDLNDSLLLEKLAFVALSLTSQTIEQYS